MPEVGLAQKVETHEKFKNSTSQPAPGVFRSYRARTEENRIPRMHSLLEKAFTGARLRCHLLP